MTINQDPSTRKTDGSAPTPITRAPTSGRACLIQYSGDTLGRRFLLDAPEIVVGRASESGIYVSDSSVSREHARIIADGNTVFLEDIGSSNGTYIHDQRIKARTPLNDGDMLRFGAILFKFFAQDNIESAFHDKIYRLATVDVGTQLYNKKYLMETLDSEFRLCRVYGRPLSVIYYDLDHFKKVNDTHGHNCGDYILRESAKMATSCMRTEDVLARVDGEEFVAILPGAEVRTAIELAERMRKAVAAFDFVFDGKKLTQTISLGISQMLPEFTSPAELLEDADKKLYQSKRAGRNRVTA